MIELEQEQEPETESKVVFDVNEDYCFEIRRSAYPQLWADDQGNVFRMSKNGRLFVPKTWINNTGYEITNTTNDNGKHTTVPLHRIVATAWLDNPYHLSDVDHIDDDQLNNAVSNLQWLSRADNLRKRFLDKPFSNRRAVIKFNNTTNAQVAHYHSISEAARENKLSYSSVRGNANHQLKLAKDYYFEFAQGQQQLQEEK